MLHSKIHRSAIGFGLCLASANLASAMVSSFDTGNENWRIITYPNTASIASYTDYGPAVWFATGGTPGGYIRQTTDPDGGDIFALAPAQFLGPDSYAYGKTLSYDLFDAAGNEYNPSSTVILEGAGKTLSYISTTVASPAAGTFNHFVIPLSTTAAGWTLNGYGGTAASAADLQAALSNITLLAIRLEYHSGPDDSGIDNINFAKLPGDANGDGHINADDYALTDRGFNKHLAGWSNGDLNGDGAVNASDYLILDTAYAQSNGQSPDLATLPEPAALILLPAAAILLSRRRRLSLPV